MSLLSGTEKMVLGAAGFPHSQKTSLLISAFEIITPGENSYCEASMIDMKNQFGSKTDIALFFQMAQTRPFYLV